MSKTFTVSQHRAANLAEVVDHVLMYLDNHRREAVDVLFPLNATNDGYRDGWRKMEPLRFWGRLDLGNRRELVRAALEYYAPIIAEREAIRAAELQAVLAEKVEG